MRAVLQSRCVRETDLWAFCRCERDSQIIFPIDAVLRGCGQLERGRGGGGYLVVLFPLPSRPSRGVWRYLRGVPQGRQWAAGSAGLLVGDGYLNYQGGPHSSHEVCIQTVRMLYAQRDWMGRELPNCLNRAGGAGSH